MGCSTGKRPKREFDAGGRAPGCMPLDGDSFVGLKPSWMSRFRLFDEEKNESLYLAAACDASALRPVPQCFESVIVAQSTGHERVSELVTRPERKEGRGGKGRGRS